MPSITAAELIAYNSVNKPLNDTDNTGGAIDRDYRANFTQIAANDTIEMVSSSGADAGGGAVNVTIRGRNAAGVIVTDTKATNGTSTVAFTGTFERILSAALAADAVGTITIRRSSSGPTVGTIVPGERGFYALFIDSASESSQAVRYEKIFWANTNLTLTLTNAKINCTVDPDVRIEIATSTVVDDTNSSGSGGAAGNRKTAPTNQLVSFVDGTGDVAVPSGQLAAGSAIGVWIKQTLPADDPARKSSFTTQLSGTTV